MTRALSIPLLFLAMLFAVGAASAQAWPARQVRLVIPFPPGGATDIIGRIVAQRLSTALGQSVVVENKPGAGGAIGSDIVAKAAPDGYTILIGTSSTHSVAPALGVKLPYDPTRDFAPIIHLSDAPRVLVVSSTLPFKSVADLIASAKAKPGFYNYGSSGIGTTVHLSAEAFKLAAKVDVTHVPYKGTALVFTDLATGQISLMFDSIVSAQPSLKSGKVRALGVTSARRSPLMPELPTMVEAGLPGFIDETYFGLWVPAGTPAAVVARVNAEANKLLQGAEMKEQLAIQGASPVGGTAQEFTRRIADETAKWTRVVKEAGIKPE
jgi:tripartite-type tricarboxylate transporter receptor subunit TctC